MTKISNTRHHNASRDSGGRSAHKKGFSHDPFLHDAIDRAVSEYCSFRRPTLSRVAEVCIAALHTENLRRQFDGLNAINVPSERSFKRMITRELSTRDPKKIFEKRHGREAATRRFVKGGV